MQRPNTREYEADKRRSISRLTVALIFLSYGLVANAEATGEATSKIPTSLHVLLCTGKNTKLLARAPAPYMGQIQQQPGTSPGQAILGTIIGVVIAGKIINHGIADDTEFRNKLADQLANIRAEDMVNERFRSKLSGANGFSNTSWEVVASSSDLEQAGLLVKIQEEKILTIDSNIQLDAKSGHIVHSTTVNLWRKTESIPCFKAELSNRIEPEANNPRTIWIEDHGEKLSAAIDKSVDQAVAALLDKPELIAALTSSPATR